jgi:hypothetical protein
MMARFKVAIGSPDGKEGDEVVVQATSPADASAQVLASDAMIRNPHWQITEGPTKL